MNDNAQNMITLSVVVVLFLSACFYTLGLTSQINLVLNHAVMTLGGQTRSVHTTLKTAKPDIFSGTQAIVMTVDHINSGVKIQVDDTMVLETVAVELISQSIFQIDANYRAVYNRDINGKLIEIQFYKLLLEEDDL
ncbi:hypothetical protein GRF59_01430 [Paenibacillus sp. HJL G12]|uniref:Uncharacterized protein n=1 Tax=Paenibacillus dendrobii TaxID=2691084 RepID=A0A7X3IE76_9BACL|nr:hypothetical protein [Paenibacillus dendrobii]MWV42279.1 hypothetical protein [Paenibacillus dendrobii]